MTKIEKFREYIKSTYEKLGEINYSNYWNLGYINCLMDNKMIDRIVGAGLVGYNDRIYFVESMRPMNRRIREEELKKMTLEKIENDIDERIKLVYKKLMPERGCTRQTTEFLSEIHTAMAIYKELIQKIVCMDEDRTAYQFCWKAELTEYIKKLEEKYYPQPKSTREKINDIIEKYSGVNFNPEGLKSALIRLRDELPD